MLSDEQIEMVLALLREDRLSQREIARTLRLSRTTVARIAQGERYPGQRESDLVEEPTTPPVRCPGCGGMVQLPCMLCRLRAHDEERRQRRRRLRAVLAGPLPRAVLDALPPEPAAELPLRKLPARGLPVREVPAPCEPVQAVSAIPAPLETEPLATAAWPVPLHVPGM